MGHALAKWSLTLSKMTNLDSSKPKEFAHGNFQFDENGRKFSEKKNCWKRRNCS